MEERQFKGIWIPKEIWLTSELSLQEKVILVEIESLEDEEKGCFASNNYFAKFFNLTPSRVSQIINLLVEKDYLEVDYVKKGKQIVNRVIRIKRPPYPEVFNLLNRGIKYSKEGYLENCEDNNISFNNIEEIDNNKLLSTKKKTKKEFTPPTLEEVEAYCKERNNNVDPNKFINHYTSNGWKVGKVSMKDWKAAVRTWETNSNQPKKKTREQEFQEQLERMRKLDEEEERLRNEQTRNS